MKTSVSQRLRLPLSTLLLGLASQVSADGGGSYSVYDKNQDGYIDREEFEALAQRRRKNPDYGDIWYFEHVDQDGDGKISELELVNALQEQLMRKQRK